jgi:hypothetical protein
MVLNKVDCFLFLAIFQCRVWILLHVLHVWNLDLRYELVNSVLSILEAVRLKLILKRFLPSPYLRNFFDLSLNNLVILPLFQRFHLIFKDLYSALSVSNQFAQKFVFYYVGLIFVSLLGTWETSVSIRGPFSRRSICRVI